MWRWVVGNVIPLKMSFGCNFSDKPWRSYALVNLQLTFQLSKNRNFCILRLFEPCFENHDQELIKWCFWLQNKMLPKIFDFWLSNDHFTPAVDCEAIRAFDCATWCCESWNLTYGCLTMYIGIWDLYSLLTTLQILVLHIETMFVNFASKSSNQAITCDFNFWVVSSLKTSCL